MTPKQIANNLALVAMANADDAEQVSNASALLAKTVPHLRNVMTAQLETAGMDQRAIHAAYSDLFLAAITSVAGDDMDEEVAESDILGDDVGDEDDVEPVDEEELQLASQGSLMDNMAMLKELAMGEINGKGQFIPLDDIDDSEAVDDEEQASPRKPVKEQLDTPVGGMKRRSFNGTIAKR